MIRKIWSGERSLRFDGEHYHLAGAQGGPVPLEPIGIWLGAYGPRALALTGAAADGWVPSFRGDFAALAGMARRLDQAAADAGRDPFEIRRVLNVSGTITDTTSEGPLNGPLAQWVDELSELADSYGFDTFILWNDDPTQLDRFAHEVVPALRSGVG